MVYNTPCTKKANIAEWSSPVAREAHNLEVVGSNPASATNKDKSKDLSFFIQSEGLVWYLALASM